MAGALKNGTILTFPNVSSNEGILKTDEDFASMGASMGGKNSSPGLFNPETPLNTSSDEQEKVSGMDWDLTKIIGFCLGFALVANLILAIIAGLAFSNWVKRRRDSFVKDEEETMRQGRFQFYCSRIANVICCKKNRVNCPIKIIVEDYDLTLKMQQAKIEQKEEKPEMSGQQKKGNTPGTIHLQIFTVGAECHRTSSELKKEHIETGTGGLDAIGERQNVEGFVGKDEEKN